MTGDTSDTLMRMAAFEHVRPLSEVHDHLAASHRSIVPNTWSQSVVLTP
jgi:hypothetical protein